MSYQDSTRTMEIHHHGLTLVVQVSNYTPARPMPFAQTPDCDGYDDEGSAADGDVEVVSAKVDCNETFIEAFGLNDCEEIKSQVLEEMES